MGSWSAFLFSRTLKPETEKNLWSIDAVQTLNQTTMQGLGYPSKSK